MKVVHSPRYRIDIGTHVFPTAKYDLVLGQLLEHGVITSSDVIEPAPAGWDDLSLVHTGDYLSKMRDGTLSREELALLELPWSVEMVEGFRFMVGGTIQAATIAGGIDESGKRDSARAESVVCHIGGGLHHAFANHGEGFCPFNDVAVAIRFLQALGVERSAVVDLDVHHGNGTAFIFNPGGTSAPPYPERAVTDPRVFTFSMHQQHNYPAWKPRSSLDIGLPDGTGDDRFLSELQRAMPAVMASDPHCVFYLAGADPYRDDQLGGLGLTLDGLRQRDRIVIDTVRAAGIPLVIVLAGGYARRIDDTVAIHVATVEEASRSMT